MANSVQTSSLANNLAIDAKSLDNLKYASNQNSPDAIKAAAKQFEAVLMNMMLKSMREATPQDGMMDNEQSRMFTSMLDQQLSTHLTQKGLGLAEVLTRQLSASKQKLMPATDSASEKSLTHSLTPSATNTHSSSHGATHINKPTRTSEKPTMVEALEQAKEQAYQQLEALEDAVTEGVETQLDALTPMLNDAKTSLSKLQLPDLAAVKIAKQIGDKAQAFITNMAKHAQAASEASGIPSKFMLGQAALETGWGQKQIKTINGENSHNLFGIKAGNGWKGKVAVSATTEYINGVKQTRHEKFRAYDSYADAFKDYAKLISENPRYQQAMNNTHDAKAYAYALQQAGYATDPLYGKKLSQVIAKISG